MPFWVLMLIRLAIKFGLPQIIKLFPNIPDWVVKIIEELLAKLKDPAVSNSQAKKEAIHKICNGIGCPSDLKK